jgi:hypothetical protein
MSTPQNRSTENFWLSPELRSSLLSTSLIVAVTGCQIVIWYLQTKNLLCAPHNSIEIIVKNIIFYSLTTLPLLKFWCGCFSLTKNNNLLNCKWLTLGFQLNLTLFILKLLPITALDGLNILSDFLSELTIFNGSRIELFSTIALQRSPQLKFDEVVELALQLSIGSQFI